MTGSLENIFKITPYREHLKLFDNIRNTIYQQQPNLRIIRSSLRIKNFWRTVQTSRIHVNAVVSCVMNNDNRIHKQ